MKTKVFTSTKGLELIVTSRKSAVFWEHNPAQLPAKHEAIFEFDAETFAEFIQYIEEIAVESWANLKPKDAQSFGAEYGEYYDWELDNNGYLSIRKNGLRLSRPFAESNRLYKFNKPKMESFIYDLRKMGRDTENNEEEGVEEMSASYMLVCHTCKEKMDMSQYQEHFVAETFMEWGMDTHESHHVSVIADTSSEITEEEVNLIRTYTDIPVEE